MDWLTSTYFVSFVAGGGYSVLSWLLTAGGAHGGFGHGTGTGHGTGHGTGRGIGHGTGHGTGHGIGHGIGHGHGHIASRTQSLRSTIAAPFLNLTAWSAMAGVGGGVGYLTRLAHAYGPVSLALAVPSGLCAGYLVTTLIDWLTRGTVELSDGNAAGSLATVLARVGESTTGEIRYSHDGHVSSLPARSADGSVFDIGSEVVVVEVRDGIAWVESPQKLISALSESQSQSQPQPQAER